MGQLKNFIFYSYRFPIEQHTFRPKQLEQLHHHIYVEEKKARVVYV